MSSSLPEKFPDAFDNTRLTSLQSCPRAFYIRHVLCMSSTPSEGASVSWPLNFGIAFHKFMQVLEAVYLARILIQEDPILWYEEALAGALVAYPDDPPSQDKYHFLSRARLQRTCALRYLEWLVEKREKKIITLAVEMPFEISLPSGRKITGVIDRLVEWIRRVWAWDYKTTTRAPVEGKYSPNTQGDIYAYAASKLTNREVGGTIFEIIKNIASEPDPKFRPIVSQRSPYQLLESINNIEVELDIYEKLKSENKWPARPHTCSGYGAGCQHRDICNSSSWQHRDRILESMYHREEWDPLHDRGTAVNGA